MKRILLSLTLVAVTAGALSLGATKAFFSDTETSTANTFAAGTIDLKIGNDGYYNGKASASTTWSLKDLVIEKFFDFDDVKPSDYGENTVTIKVDTNDAFVCADITLTSNNENGCNDPESLVDGTCGNPGLGEGELAQAVNFIWWADDGDNVLEDDEMIISSGKLGDLEVGEKYPVTLADSQKNIWNESQAGGAIAGGEEKYIAKAWCFGGLTPKALAQDGSGNLMSPALDNDTDGKAGTPADGGYLCDGSLLGNETQSDSMTADISFYAVQARHNDEFVCEVPEEEVLACTAEQGYATRVVASSQGTNYDGTAIAADRSATSSILGASQSNGSSYDSSVASGSFFSLGFNSNTNVNIGGGWVIVEFGDGYIVDLPGNDIRAWEITSGSNQNPYPMEKVKIEASQDGVHWVTLASSANRDMEADLEDGGLTWARYVRLTDVSERSDFTNSKYAKADGYDLDAVSALSCAVKPGGSFPPFEVVEWDTIDDGDLTDW